jgi:chaperone modulatory protein CbpM
MPRINVIGVPLEDEALTVEEIARACSVPPQWIVEHVEAGLLGEVEVAAGELRFASAQLVRARRLAFAERGFECDQEAAALVADLFEEIDRLRRELHALRRGRTR